MKNAILVLVSILMVVYGILAIFSSGYDYAAQKLFYQAMKVNRKIVLNPDVALPKMLTYVENNLQRIVKSYPNAEQAKQAHLALAEFYLNNKKYEQAHSTLYDIVNKYIQDESLLSKAHFLKGKIYEQNNQWDKALEEYIIIRDKYANTYLALRIPLYIGDYYKEKNQDEKANEAYREAASFYRKIAEEERGKGRGYAAANLSVHAYFMLKQYELAGKAVEDIINDYPKLLLLAQQLENVDLIFMQMLRKPDQAKAIYNNIRAKTDDPALIEEIEQRIKAIEMQR